MASGLIGNEVPGNRLRVRLPCPPLVDFGGFRKVLPIFLFLLFGAVISRIFTGTTRLCMSNDVIFVLHHEAPFTSHKTLSISRVAPSRTASRMTAAASISEISFNVPGSATAI